MPPTRDRTSAARDAAEALPRLSGSLVAGFDGFTDRILDVVDRRDSPAAYERVRTIEAFASRIAAAAGRSTNIELVPRRTKLGGNGAILAHAAATLGVPTVYAGTIADDEVFAPLYASARRVIGLGPPGRTDALEFDDGKIMLGEPGALSLVTWDRVLAALGGRGRAKDTLAGALLAMGNWTMTPGMTAIWDGLAREILPGAGCRGVFVDLADPAKRSDDDLRDALTALREIEAHAPVTLGLNLSEACRVAAVLGGDEPAPEPVDLAPRVRRATGLTRVAVHTRRGAALCDADGVDAFEGPYTSRPVISTGAGDHFNAGLCTGLLAAMDRGSMLAAGLACSGSYVRTGTSPTACELTAFLNALPEPETTPGR